MLTTEEVLRIIDHGNEKIMSAIFVDLIGDHKTSADNMKDLWNEYDGEADILDRAAKTGVNENKSNAKLANDYPGMIVDQVTDYTFSNGITQKFNNPTEAIKALDNGFFKVRFDRLTSRQKNYARAIAEVGHLPATSTEVAAVLGISLKKAAPVRDEIIKKGIVFSPSRGLIDFTVPKFDEFLKRIIPSKDFR